MPRLSKRAEAAARAEKREKNKCRLFDLMVAAKKVNNETRFSVSMDLVFDAEDSWAEKDIIGVQFCYEQVMEKEGVFKRGEYTTMIVLPASDDFHFDQMNDFCALAVRAEAAMKALEAERQQIVNSLTPRQRKVLGV